jgi:ribosomal protein L21
MDLKCQYNVKTGECLAIGYCNYETGGDIAEKTITSIPMDGSENINKELIKMDTATGKLVKKTQAEIIGDKKA